MRAFHITGGLIIHGGQYTFKEEQEPFHDLFTHGANLAEVGWDVFPSMLAGGVVPEVYDTFIGNEEGVEFRFELFEGFELGLFGSFDQGFIFDNLVEELEVLSCPSLLPVFIAQVV